MRNENDPVDRALKSLGGQQWPGDERNIAFEERIMRQEYQENTARFVRRRLIAASLVIALLGSVGFAAAGGVDLVRSWFVTIELNGTVVDVREVAPDEDGNAQITLPVELSGGVNELTVTVDGDADDAGEGGVRTVNVVLEDSGDSTQTVPINDSNFERPETVRIHVQDD